MDQTVKYYLGIDGGGTKTAFSLVDAHGNELATLTLGASNPNDVGIDATCALLGDGIVRLTAGYDRAEISLFAGIAGAATGDHASHITAYLRTLGFARAECQSDLALSLAACLGDSDGIAVIMGTGSVTVGRYKGELLRAGGYGYLFGDAGSGFALGQGAILAALQAQDGSGAPTLLHDLVADACGQEHVTNALADFYRGGKTEIAKYAPLIFEAHAQGDAVATDILVRNVHAIASNIRAIGNRMDTDGIRVGLCGGLMAKGAVLLPLLQDALKNDTRKYTLSSCETTPVQGAIFLASRL